MAAARLNRNLPQITISEVIKNLPSEIIEIIYKEYLTLKMKQRSALGWNEIHDELLKAPLCKYRDLVVNIAVSDGCDSCVRDGLCYACAKEEIFHYPSLQHLDGCGYFNENFCKVWK